MKQNTIRQCLLLLLISFLIYSNAVPACPNECSNNGVCNPNGACSCNEHYHGIDCSIFEEEITEGEEVSGRVEIHQWAYYSFPISSSPPILDLNVTLRELSAGDTDVYLKFGELPSLTNYDKYHAGRAKEFSVTVINPAVGTWYIGIYGYYACSFSFIAKTFTEIPCPNRCSNHGKCENDGTCTCSTGYYGADCSKAVRKLENKVPLSSSVVVRQWDYYSFELDTEMEFSVIVNETRAQGGSDCDLYIRKDALPDNWHFDHRESSLDANFVLKVTEAEAGIYYAGVLGFNGVTEYKITFNAGAKGLCASKCSNHGTCLNEECQCKIAFTGEECETMIAEVEMNKQVEGFCGEEMWNYYHITPTTANNVVIHLNQHATAGDCDLYVKEGEDPTRFDFDFRDVSGEEEFELVLENPQDIEWHIGIFGYEDCEYHLKVATNGIACPNDCSSHGTCVANGRCICNQGWAGADCSSPLHHMDNGAAKHEIVRSNNWQYFKFDVEARAERVHVILREKDTTGNLWLYVQAGAPPTLLDYQWKETSAAHSIHYLEITPNPNEAEIKYFIGVYGDPYAVAGNAIEFDVVAYSPRLN